MGLISDALRTVIIAGLLLGISAATADTVNRPLTLWMSIKHALLSDDGEAYFETSFKGAMVPGGANDVEMFEARLISVKPPLKPSVLVLSIADKTTPEVTLQLKDVEYRSTTLKRHVEQGVDVWFQGVPMSFSKNPFMVTFDVRIDDLKFERPPESGKK